MNLPKKMSFKLLSVFLFLSLSVTSVWSESFTSDGKDYSLRIGGGYSDLNDLGQILMFDFNTYSGDTYVVNVDAGWRMYEQAFDLPIDIYLKGGVSYFNENNFQNDIYEATVYFKAYYNIDAWDNRMRLGVGEGLSWASGVPYVERVDAQKDNGEVAKFLNYLEFSFDFDLGRLVGVESLKDVYVGYTIKHRSGAFGLFSGVHGGCNYKMLTIETKF